METFVMGQEDNQQSLSFAERVTRLKQSFGLPRWITGRGKQGQSALSKEKISNSVVKAPRVPIVDRFAHTRQFINVEARKIETSNFKREESVIAHVQIAELARPTPATTKSLILKWMETPVDRIAHLNDIYAAFPEVARSGISSRLSELVKSGQLLSLGKGTATYMLPQA